MVISGERIDNDEADKGKRSPLEAHSLLKLIAAEPARRCRLAQPMCANGALEAQPSWRSSTPRRLRRHATARSEHSSHRREKYANLSWPPLQWQVRPTPETRRV